MVDAVQLGTLLGELNAALGDVTPYKLAVEDPQTLLPIDKNAHYLPKRTYDQLTANIQRDGNLASLPFCWRRKDGQYVVLSGNHRVEAAQAAGIPRILLLYTDAALSVAERRAIQLSHNALIGKENPQTLRELYTEIDDLALKLYSGLDDAALDLLAPAQVQALSAAALAFEELRFIFVPAEVERIQGILNRLGPMTSQDHMMRLDDFARFFEVLLTYKDASGVVNSSTALLGMCNIVEEWMAIQANVMQ